MKVGLAIAPENALPSAFVVFRDKLETSMAKAAANPILNFVDTGRC